MRKYLKKISAVMLTSVMIVSLLSGCGGSKEKDNTGVVTISLGMHVANCEEQEAVTYEIVEAFNQSQDEIKVEIQGNDKDEHVKKMKMAAQSGDLPDVFWMDSSVAADLGAANAVLDLSEFLEANPDISKEISDNMKAANQAADIQYGLPYQSLVTGLWYNKAVFDENQVAPPKNGTTYEELLDMVEQLNAKGVTPIAKGAKDTYSVWAFLIGLERYGYFDKIDDILAGKEKFENPEFVKYFEKLSELGEKGAFPSNMSTLSYFQAKEQFNAGKTAMFDSGMWDAGDLDGTIGENIGFWWGPTFSDTEAEQKVNMKVSSAPLCVSANVGEDDAKKEAVYKFLAFYYGEEAAKISYEGSVIPATNYQVDIDLSKKPAFAAIVEALEEGWVSPKAQPDLVLNEAVQAQLYDSIYGTMLGTYKPSEALKKLDDILAQQ